MEERSAAEAAEIEDRLAARLRALRLERGWSLDELAAASGLSRASLSRLENKQVSATAAALSRLCSVYGLTLSRLFAEAEEGDTAALVRRAAQPVWTDPGSGYRRRSVSPPARGFDCELVECELPPAARIDYAAPPRAGLEHHLLLLEGSLTVTLEGRPHRLEPGDALRYRLFGASCFAAPAACGARYLLAIR